MPARPALFYFSLRLIPLAAGVLQLPLKSEIPATFGCAAIEKVSKLQIAFAVCGSDSVMDDFFRVSYKTLHAVFFDDTQRKAA